jgi:two-component system, chemotaxis family, chemotaxis protein CheY
MGKIILIVNAVTAQFHALENILRQAGYKQVLHAKNVKGALETLEKEKDIGLVISEWDLPEKSGLDLLQAISSSGKADKVPVVLTFMDKREEDILRAKQSGVKGFIVKPYKYDVVRQKVTEIIGVDGQSDTQKIKRVIPEIIELDDPPK